MTVSFKNAGGDAITAKIRAMYGRRLTALNYRELARKQTVNEVAAYLKQQTSYADLLHDINENLVHRGQLEMIIKRRLFEEYLKIFHYISGDEIEFYRFLIHRMEMDEIISCIRFLNAGREDEYIFTLPSFFAKHATFDLYSLAKVKDYGGLLDLLKSTSYAPVLSKYIPHEGGQIDIVKIEIEFDKLYYEGLLKNIDGSFRGEIRNQLRNSFGMEIDLSNITDILRLKKYFNESAKYIKSLLLPYYFNVRQSELDKMIAAEDAQSAWKAACQTHYGKVFNAFKFDFVEKYAQEVIYEYHKKLLVQSMSAPVVVVAYVRLKSNEITNLINIIEGIRYGLEPSEIDKLLVGTGN